MCGGCRCCKGKVEPSDVVFIPRKQRKCTDCLFCILFLLFWVGMVAIAGVAVSGGDPDRLLYGVDHESKVCGSSDRSGLPYIYYPRITEDIVNFATSGETNPLNIELFGLCRASCPSMGDVVCTAAGRDAISTVQTSDPSLSDIEVMGLTDDASAWATHGVSTMKAIKRGCWVVPLKTTSYFWRCLWQRNTTTTTTVTCLEPPSMRGVVINSTTSQEVKDACISKRVVTTSDSQTAGQDDPLMDQMFDTVAMVGRYVSDVTKAMVPIFICGGLLAILFGALWLLVIQRCAACMVWTTIWLVVVVLFSFTLYAYDQAGLLDVAINAAVDSFNDAAGTTESNGEPEELSTAESDLQTRWKWFAIVLTVVLVIVMLLIVFMASRIKIAIAMIKEAALSVRKAPTLMVFPFFSVVLSIVLFVYWIVVAGFIYSNGDVAASTTTKSESEVSADPTLQRLLCARYPNGTIDTTSCVSMDAAAAFEAATSNDFMMMYHFLGLLWTNQFIAGFFIMSIAGAVCQLYFGVREKKEDRPTLVVWSAVKTTITKHLGSIAFGSLIIAIIQFIRAVLAYLDRKSKKVQQSNMVLKLVFKCLACCLWCFEKCVKFISINAYIIIAMKGKSFCPAAAEAVMTILKNLAQVSVVNTISVCLFVLGKILITCGCGALCFLWIDNADSFKSGEDELSSYWAPMLLTLLLSFAIATAFMHVLGIAIDTMLICVCVDTQRPQAGTEEKPYYASKPLLKALGIGSGVSYGNGFVRVTPKQSHNNGGGGGGGKML